MAELSRTEQLLRSALSPVEPPGALTDRVERRLTELTDLAVEELADWELGAMRDPRNWGRPVAALLVGGVAGGALVFVRARQTRRQRGTHPVAALRRGAREVAGDVSRRLSG